MCMQGGQMEGMGTNISIRMSKRVILKCMELTAYLKRKNTTGNKLLN